MSRYPSHSPEPPRSSRSASRWSIAPALDPPVGSAGPAPQARPQVPGRHRRPLPAPTPPATPAPTPSPSPTIDTTGWKDFVSTRYGYSIGYPADWKAERATRDWVLATDRGSNLLDGQADGFIGGPDGDQTRVANFAADVPAGMSEDAWLASYYAGGAYCPTTPTFVPITVDGHPGRLDTCFDAQAFVFVGQRVYAFSIWRTEHQPLFRAFLSTVRLPASAPSGSPGASASP